MEALPEAGTSNSFYVAIALWFPLSRLNLINPFDLSKFSYLCVHCRRLGNILKKHKNKKDQYYHPSIQRETLMLFCYIFPSFAFPIIPLLSCPLSSSLLSPPPLCFHFLRQLEVSSGEKLLHCCRVLGSSGTCCYLHFLSTTHKGITWIKIWAFLSCWKLVSRDL